MLPLGILEQELAATQLSMGSISEDIANTEEKIHSLNKHLNNKRDEHRLAEHTYKIVNKLLEREQKEAATDQHANEGPAAAAIDDLGPLQLATYSILPASKSYGLSCSEVRGMLHEAGKPIKRNSNVHKVLSALEAKRLATYTKIGRTFYWFKAS